MVSLTFMESISFNKIVEEFERAGPRYTSYPTAPVWKSDFKNSDFKLALKTQVQPGSPLSLYLHLPFCEKLCHFCACNRVIDPRREHAETYLRAIESELQLYSDELEGRGTIEQMHWGGGTPTFYSPMELERLFSSIESKFKWGINPEISIEVNPVVTTKDHLRTLATLGFNRISLGVQDFDPKVQEVINRHQTFDQTKTLVEQARQFGFQSLNLDLIYGLPLQTSETISQTIEHVTQIRPDRIAFYSYANVPWKQPFQRRFKDSDLPTGAEKISLYIIAKNLLDAVGYQTIGMDHFALPDDELFKARQNKKLHRNFMGYTTRGDTQMIAAGISAISMLDEVYVQNKKTLPSYYADLKNRTFPIERGHALTFDDRIRRKIILDLMCNFEIEFENVEATFNVSFVKYFSSEMARLHFFEEKGLLQLFPERIKVTDNGRLLVRNIAMVFDRYLEDLPPQSLFSKTI